jgi:2-succinyl-5-enolpyruvyl-6-hydroxy-3-cyclohexene-1-carboxylate synthase
MSVWQTAVSTVETCLEAGITEYIVCAGARNAPLLEALARAHSAGHIRVWNHFEERSAAYFALGRTQSHGNPCAVVTTSGTAVAELLPAVIEAFYQEKPLVCITADRPPSYRGTGSPQSIDQTSLLATHAHTAGLASWNGRSPIHWNVELDESFDPAEDRFPSLTPAPPRPTPVRIDVAALARWLRRDAYQGLVVLIGDLEPLEREEVFHFCQALRAPVLADATSGLREALQALALPDGDRLLRTHPPGKILRLGGVPSGRFWRDLESLPNIDVWSVCRNGLPGLARPSNVTPGPLDRVLPALGDIDEIGDALDHFPLRARRLAVIEELLETYPDSEPGLIRSISQYISLGNSLTLGNSLPIREWNLFAQNDRPLTQVRANRGANGIDGQISTWLGESAETTHAWALLGDLTTLYDLAAPFILPQIESTGRVLAVINNHGGRIFDRLPRLNSMQPKTTEWLANPHQANLSGIAQLWNMDHLQIRTIDDLDAFNPDLPKTQLLEILPNPSQTHAFWQNWDRLAP